MFVLAPVDLSKAHPGLARLTYPRFRPWFEEAGAAPETVSAVAALADGRCVGLGVMRRERGDVVRLLSIMVEAASRRAGFGTALLNAVEDDARAQGASAVDAHFGGRADRTAFVSLLKRCGWPDPEHLEHRVACRADWMDRKGPKWASFMERVRRGGYAATPWFEITAEDRSRAIAIEAANAPPHWPRFAVFEAEADPLLCVALRRQGELVGWIHCQGKPELGYHHYVTGFVEDALQRKGWLLAGLDSVCRTQAAAYGAASVAVYETPGDAPRMRAFMEKHLTPVCLWTDNRYRCIKALK